MKKYTYIDDLEKWRQEFKFFIEINIRFSETDMFGHMNNVSPFIYFEEARIEFMKNINLFNFNEKPVEIPIVADLQCDYHAQVYFGETIFLYVKANAVGKSSVDIHYMALNETGKICFTGRGRVVKINVRTGKPVALHEAERAKLTSQTQMHS